MWLYQQNCMSPSDKMSSGASKGSVRRPLSPQPTFFVSRKPRHRGGNSGGRPKYEDSQNSYRGTNISSDEEGSMASGISTEKQSMVSVELYGSEDTPRSSVENDVKACCKLLVENRAQGDCCISCGVEISRENESEFFDTETHLEGESKRKKVEDEDCEDSIISASDWLSQRKEKRREMVHIQAMRRPAESTGAKPKTRRVQPSPCRNPKTAKHHSRPSKHVMAADYREIAGGDFPPRPITFPGSNITETPKQIKLNYRPLNQIVSAEGTPDLAVAEFPVQPQPRNPNRVCWSQPSPTPKPVQMEDGETAPAPANKISPTGLQYQLPPEPKQLDDTAEILLISEEESVDGRLEAGGQDVKTSEMILSRIETDRSEIPSPEQANVGYPKEAQGASEKLIHRSNIRWWRSSVVRAGIATLAVLGIIAISIAILSETSSKPNSVKGPGKSDMGNVYSYRSKQCLADPPPPQNSCEKWNWSGTTRVIGIVITYRCSTLENFPVIRVAECDSKQTWNLENVGVGVCECPSLNSTS